MTFATFNTEGNTEVLILQLHIWVKTGVITAADKFKYMAFVLSIHVALGVSSNFSCVST